MTLHNSLDVEADSAVATSVTIYVTINNTSHHRINPDNGASHFTLQTLAFAFVGRHWLCKCGNRAVSKYLLHSHTWLGIVLHVCVIHLHTPMVSLQQSLEHTKVFWFIRNRSQVIDPQQFWDGKQSNLRWKRHNSLHTAVECWKSLV